MDKKNFVACVCSQDIFFRDCPDLIFFRDSPDFKCFECYEQGHFAKDCKAYKCPDCGKAFMRCDCESEHEEEINDETENGEPENNMKILNMVNDEEEEDGSVKDVDDSKRHGQEKAGDKKLEGGEGVEMVGNMVEGWGFQGMIQSKRGRRTEMRRCKWKNA